MKRFQNPVSSSPAFSWALTAGLGLSLLGCADSHGRAFEVGAAGAAQTCSEHVISTGYAGSNSAAFAIEEGFPQVGQVPADDGRTMSAVTELDLDGDGYRDLIMRDAYGGAALVTEPVSLQIVWGADAPFAERRQEERVIALDLDPAPLRLMGDLDGDGMGDLLVDYIGTVVSSATFEVLPILCWGQTIGDVDGDGVPDSGCVSRNGEGPRSVRVLYGGSVPPRETTIPNTAFDTWGVMGVGDIDGDGRDEAFIRSIEGIGIWHDEEPSSFDPMEIVKRVGNLGPQALGDVNGDGFDDVLIREDSAPSLLFGSTSGLERTALSLEGTLLAVRDADCDGFADVLVERTADDARTWVALHRGGATGLSDEPSWESLVHRYPSQLTLMHD